MPAHRESNLSFEIRPKELKITTRVEKSKLTGQNVSIHEHNMGHDCMTFIYGICLKWWKSYGTKYTFTIMVKVYFVKIFIFPAKVAINQFFHIIYT